MTCPENALVQKIIMAISLFVFIGFTIPAMALPPAMEADKQSLFWDKFNMEFYK